MKIQYDYQIFTSQKHGGISRYFFELIKYYKENNIDVNTSLVFSNNHYISDKTYVKHMRFFSAKEFRGKERVMAPINKIKSIYKIKKQNFDVFHPTYYDPYFLESIGNKPFVLTVYDMIHEKFIDIIPKHDNTSVRKRTLVEKASKVIAISESTKKDLIEIFGIDNSKIEVIYLATSLSLPKDFITDIKLPKEYILFVGVRNGYKNFNRFICSISDILNEKKELYVVCIGGGRFLEDEITLLKKLNIEDKVFQYTVDDSLLAYYYSNALMFVFASLYEGFGIPVLESFSCRCPLVCSNISSLPEIAKDGAEYFDPYDELSIKSAIVNVLGSEERREQLKRNGSLRLKDFSWEKTAKQTKEVYESLIV